MNQDLPRSMMAVAIDLETMSPFIGARPVYRARNRGHDLMK